MRVLIAALLLITTLLIANLAASYLALSRVAGALPETMPPLPAPAPAIERDLMDTDTTGEDEGDLAAARNARALQAAKAADPEIAALVDDQDPKVRNAMRAFFEDAPAAAAQP
jgi:hypothetical protein